MRMPLARLIVGASLEIMACRNHRAVYISDARIPSVGVGLGRAAAWWYVVFLLRGLRNGNLKKTKRAGFSRRMALPGFGICVNLCRLI